MNDAKYIGLDVHQATISAVILDSNGRLVMESILETKASTILQFIHGLRGSLHVTFEEGTCAAGCTTCLSHMSPKWWCVTLGKCSVEGRQQERPDRCAQAGYSSPQRITLRGISRRERRADLERNWPAATWPSLRISRG